jgi:hypothetical protein
MNVNDQKDFIRQNRTWGVGVWFYAVVCSIVFMAGFFINPLYYFQENIIDPFQKLFGESFSLSFFGMVQ